MTKNLDRALTELLPGMMLHDDAKRLPPETQGALESGRGGTFVIWKARRPLAVVVVLPAVPDSDDEIRKGLARLAELFVESPSPRRKKPRRRRS